MPHVKCNHSFNERRPLLSRSNTSSPKPSKPIDIVPQTPNNSRSAAAGARSPTRKMHKYTQHPWYSSIPSPTFPSVKPASWGCRNGVSGSSYIPDSEIAESLTQKKSASNASKSVKSESEPQDSDQASSTEVVVPPSSTEGEKDLESQTSFCDCECGSEESYQNPKQTPPQLKGKKCQSCLSTHTPRKAKRQSWKGYWLTLLLLSVIFTYYVVGVVKLNMDCPYGTTADEEVCGKGVRFCCDGRHETWTYLPPVAVKAMDTMMPVPDGGVRWWANEWTG